ncbi:MAG: cupin domain-containing protein [Pseudomonadota bacterium]
MTKKHPILIEPRYLEGNGLTPVDLATAPKDPNITTEGPIKFSTHMIFSGKISSYVFETEPGRVRIDGLPYDEYINILEGRLILTPDDGEAMEFKTGDSFIIPEGYKGYWEMPEKYREFVIINTVSE